MALPTFYGSQVECNGKPLGMYFGVGSFKARPPKNSTTNTLQTMRLAIELSEKGSITKAEQYLSSIESESSKHKSFLPLGNTVYTQPNLNYKNTLFNEALDVFVENRGKE